MHDGQQEESLIPHGLESPQDMSQPGAPDLEITAAADITRSSEAAPQRGHFSGFSDDLSRRCSLTELHFVQRYS